MSEFLSFEERIGIYIILFPRNGRVAAWQLSDYCTAGTDLLWEADTKS